LSRFDDGATIDPARSDPERRGDIVDKKAKTPKKPKQNKAKTAK